jgi:hypothetical protein
LDIVNVRADGQVQLLVTHDELDLISNSVLNALEFVPKRHYHAHMGCEPDDAESFISTLYQLEIDHGLREVVDSDHGGGAQESDDPV